MIQVRDVATESRRKFLKQQSKKYPSPYEQLLKECRIADCLVFVSVLLAIFGIWLLLWTV